MSFILIHIFRFNLHIQIFCHHHSKKHCLCLFVVNQFTLKLKPFVLEESFLRCRIVKGDKTFQPSKLKESSLHEEVSNSKAAESPWYWPHSLGLQATEGEGHSFWFTVPGYSPSLHESHLHSQEWREIVKSMENTYILPLSVLSPLVQQEAVLPTASGSPSAINKKQSPWTCPQVKLI